jgi:hypothetical protein
MAGGGPGPASPVNLFEARLKTDLAGVSNTLTLLPYKGNRVEIRGRLIRLGAGGLTRGIGDNLIDAAGADAGAAGAASTLYYVYVSNTLATFSPASIRLSATAPSVVNGVRYLGAAGNALNWRFVGWVFLNATPNFESSVANALIVNYYNRLLYSIFANPGYVDDNAQTSYAVNGNWAAANGGSGSRVSFVSNGEDSAIIQTHATHFGTAGVDVYSGPGIDGAAPLKAGKATCGAVYLIGMTVDDSKVLSEGYHFADLYGAGDANAFFVADFARLGAAADPRGSLISVDVFV